MRSNKRFLLPISLSPLLRRGAGIHKRRIAIYGLERVRSAEPLLGLRVAGKSVPSWGSALRFMEIIRRTICAPDYTIHFHSAAPARICHRWPVSSQLSSCRTCHGELPPGAAACPACGQPVPPPLPGGLGSPRNARHWIVPTILLIPAGLCAATAKLEGLPILLALAGTGLSAVGGAIWAAGWKARMGKWWIVPCVLIGLAFGAVSLVLCFFGCSAGGFRLNMH